MDTVDNGRKMLANPSEERLRCHLLRGQLLICWNEHCTEKKNNL